MPTSVQLDIKTKKRFFNFFGLFIVSYLKTSLRSPGNRYLGIWFRGGSDMHGFWF